LLSFLGLHFSQTLPSLAAFTQHFISQALPSFLAFSQQFSALAMLKLANSAMAQAMAVSDLTDFILFLSWPVDSSTETSVYLGSTNGQSDSAWTS
jgi:hypothetical protein